ncbi:hypothetical protein HOG98_01345 [bacterium]|jgi:hypothetical protein|nr:hypothetical protein [bacterium]
MSDELKAIYDTAITLVERDLKTRIDEYSRGPSKKGVLEGHGTLSDETKCLIRQIAVMEKGSNFRHNPVLRRSLYDARENLMGRPTYKGLFDAMTEKSSKKGGFSKALDPETAISARNLNLTIRGGRGTSERHEYNHKLKAGNRRNLFRILYKQVIAEENKVHRAPRTPTTDRVPKHASMGGSSVGGSGASMFRRRMSFIDVSKLPSAGDSSERDSGMDRPRRVVDDASRKRARDE